MFWLHVIVLLVIATSVTAPLPNRVERAANPSLSSFFLRVSHLLRAFERFTENHDLGNPRQLSESSLRTLEEIWETLQVALTHFERLESEPSADLHQSVSRSLEGILRFLTRVRERIQSDNSVPTETSVNQGSSCQRLPTGSRGPPRYDIQQQQLETLLNMRMTVSDIARSGILGTSNRNTIYNHCQRLNVQLPRQRYATITDERLRQTVDEIHQDQPNSGSEEIRATLASRGIIVHRYRVRRALSIVDPSGSASRWAQTIRRRMYSVPSPNSLWHLDNNHALKRWGFYVHGGIDGFSRCLPFLTVTTRNTGRNALLCFLQGIRERGLPSRIRLDKGAEYNECHRFMEWRMGANRGSAIRGQSVHNQRIERLWRDVFTKVLEKFYKLFYHLEDTEALDIDNPIHLFALRYTYHPRIQAALNNWKIVHNNHGIRTERFRTPEQLWVSNIIKQRCNLQFQAQRPPHGPTPSVAVNNIIDFDINDLAGDISTMFNIDLADIQTGRIGSDLPPLPFFSANDLVQLRHRIDPLRHSDVHGLDIYGEVLVFVIDCQDRQQNRTEGLDNID